VEDNLGAGQQWTLHSEWFLAGSCVVPTASTTEITAPPKSFGRANPAGFLARSWPWFVLGLSAFFFSVHFIPKLYFASMDTETIVLPLFYHDLVVMHHSPSNWAWGGFSAVFPDVTVFFLLNFLVRDGHLALQLLLICIFIGWLAGSAALGVVARRPHRLSLFSMLLLLWVGLSCDLGLPPEMSLFLRNPLFQPIYHSGTGLLCLVCLALFLGEVSHGRTAGFYWLLALVFLAGISDILFLVVFVVPALASLVLVAAAYPRNWKNHLSLFLNLAISAMASYFLATACFPVTLATGNFIQWDFGRASVSFSLLTDELSNPERHFFVFMTVLDGLTVLGGIVGVLFFYFSKWKRHVSPLGFTVMAFCVATIPANWIAAIYSGDYQGITSNRYLTVALLAPMFLAVFGLHAFIPQEPTINYTNTMGDIPFLKAAMKTNHIHACLANYWNANITTFLSDGDVATRSLASDGSIYTWFNSLEWFGKGHPVEDLPHFRLIYIPDHDFAQRFGPPDQLLHAPSGGEVWIYSEARSILYNEHFETLSNNFVNDGRTVRFSPSNLPGDLSRFQDHSRLAIEGQDNDSWLEYGPYLSLTPGRYRAAFSYTYLAPPAAGKFPTYDLLVHTGVREKSFHSTSLPSPNSGPQIFTDDFDVREPGHLYEMRIRYHGSGTIRVDSLDVTYVGP
jgi:hypothetical protein